MEAKFQAVLAGIFVLSQGLSDQVSAGRSNFAQSGFGREASDQEFPNLVPATEGEFTAIRSSGREEARDLA